MAKKQATNDQGTEAERLEVGETATVKMTRDTELYPAPHTADVHPDEVDNYSAAGWVTKE